MMSLLAQTVDASGPELALSSDKLLSAARVYDNVCSTHEAEKGVQSREHIASRVSLAGDSIAHCAVALLHANEPYPKSEVAEAAKPSAPPPAKQPVKQPLRSSELATSDEVRTRAIPLKSELKRNKIPKRVSFSEEADRATRAMDEEPATDTKSQALTRSDCWRRVSSALHHFFLADLEDGYSKKDLVF